MRLAILLFILTAILSSFGEAQPPEHSPQLLLTPQRLKRLKRDRERQTPRWTNFEQRVKTVPDSPERGFELALYYAVTGDESRGKEAVIWAKTHHSEYRQVALILDWCRDFISAEEQKALSNCITVGPGALSQIHFAAVRGCLFIELAGGSPFSPSDPEFWNKQIDWLVHEGFQQSNELYAATEVISVLRTAGHLDLREDAPRSFNSLPVQFLLSLKPDQVEHPEWRTHIAALALVSLAPNNDSSQFLQGWAIEDRQMIHDGPGVGYELLWADPYLPGVGYQNLDPWWYDEAGGVLLARSNWEPNACWIQITPQGVQQVNCPANWQTKPGTFGHLQLIPMTQNCLEISRPAQNSATILWKLKPNQRLKYGESGKTSTVVSKASGLWRVPVDADGKVCAVR